MNRPKVRLEIWAPDGREVTVSEMRIDDEIVAANYVVGSRTFEYLPKSPFPAGEHTVQCRIGFKGTPVFKTGWKFKVLPNALGDLPAPTADQVSALAEVNRYRKAMGLPDFLADSVLNYGASRHAAYCAANEVLAHQQTPGKDEFFGLTSFERLASLGWVGRSYEGVTEGEDSMAAAIASLFDSPYHRLPFMQPGPASFGFGRQRDKTTVEMGDCEIEGFTVSPGAGETGVRTTWSRQESPNPLRLHKGADLPTGYPIVAALFGVKRVLSEVKAELTTGGKPVPFYLNSSANDDELQGQAFIIPKHPLKANTAYDVSVQGVDERGVTVAKRWSFTTGAS